MWTVNFQKLIGFGLKKNNKIEYCGERGWSGDERILSGELQTPAWLQ